MAVNITALIYQNQPRLQLTGEEPQTEQHGQTDQQAKPAVAAAAQRTPRHLYGNAARKEHRRRQPQHSRHAQREPVVRVAEALRLAQNVSAGERDESHQNAAHPYPHANAELVRLDGVVAREAWRPGVIAAARLARIAAAA